jgi:predicted amidohydrolase
MTMIAICQINIQQGAVEENFMKVYDFISTAADEGAEIIVFPELTLTGYLFDDDWFLDDLAMKADDIRLLEINDYCLHRRVISTIGFIESGSNCYYNTVGLLGLHRAIPRYQKIHLPRLGIDRFLSKGDLGLPVFHTDVALLGVNICYDQQFPESARVLALQGAQVILVPTSETRARHEVTDLQSRTRAYENRVFYVWVNRVGTESREVYNGSSRIINPLGERIALAGSHDEEILYREIDPTQADDKRAFSDTEYQDCDHNFLFDRSPQDYSILI